MSKEPGAGDIITKKLKDIRREGEEREAERLAAEKGILYLDLRTAPVSLEALALLPEADAKEAHLAVVQKKKKELAVILSRPDAVESKKIIQKLAQEGYAVKRYAVSESGLAEAWRSYTHVAKETAGITGKFEIEKGRLEAYSKDLSTMEAVQRELGKLDFTALLTLQIFEIVVAGALANRASDIHFEAEEKQAKIRFRIDGILHDIYDNLPPRNYHALSSRIKLLSGLKINVQNEAQDGRFTIELTKKDVEVRVSSIPSEYGETIVLRILDPDTINIDLETLGLREDDLKIVEREILKPNGLILNTGPTGSGKTTTLYAFLKRVNSPDIKIITIEDPIEYHLGGVEQTQVDPKTGYTFVNGLRSILRQDPDTILVGEIRDTETAEIAIQASLTGHLVFSTLHTNDAVGAVPRLVDLGVKATSVGPALTLVIAQRLVRRLCLSCKKKISISEELKRKIDTFISRLPPRVNREKYTHPEIFEAPGCAECNHTGYRGRVAVFEFLETGPEFEEAILKQVSEVSLKHIAERQAMVKMQEDGVLKVILGITSFEEVEKATGPISW
ncbi:MAG: type II/IV secretion system protein [Candidatus Liptonbacteria bacterium]|nr:type II/IV secretion system protein [Candidatus Liptonbacteria bacterium]